MGLSILLRAAAIVGAFIWGIFLIRGWIAYSEMQSYKGLFYDKAISDAKDALIIQSVVVLILFCGGIFGGGSNSKEEKEGEQPKGGIDKIMSFSEEAFVGDVDLENDAYKLFLVKKYAIEKNNALSKFVVNEKLFNSIDEALLFASELEITSKFAKDAEAKAYQEGVEAEKQKKIDYLSSPEFKRKKLFKQLGNAFLLCGVITMILIGLNGNKSQPQQASSSSFNSTFVEVTGKEYGEGYGIVVGQNSQDAADKAANLICQKNSTSKKCGKLYGDQMRCAALAYSPLLGSVAVGTANSLDLAKLTAINLCNKNNENPNIMDCVVANDKVGALCSN